MTAAFLLAGCAPVEVGDSGGAAVTLTDATAWALLPAGSDPLPGHRPAEVSCAPATWGEELGVLEVQTGACAYFAAAQVVTVPRSASSATAWVWHLGLDAEAPAEGHVALLVDETVVWEETVAIPASAQAFEAGFDLGPWRGQEVALSWHLHNHGFNAWALDGVSVDPRR